MSPTYHKRRRECRLRSSRAGVDARERKRMARAEGCGEWPVVATMVLVVTAAPDGRHMGLQVIGREEWYLTGTRRALVGRLGKLIVEAIGRKREREAGEG